MPTANTGMPTAAQMNTYTDALANNLITAASAMGIGAPGESDTMAAVFAATTVSILGDGVSTYGIGNPTWQQQITPTLITAAGAERYDYLINRQQLLMLYISTAVQQNMPSNWSFTGTNPLDAWLAYLNGANGAPATPASAGVLTAVNNVAGQMPNSTSGNCPYVCHTLVGSASQNVSLPTGNATQVAITGSNNALSYQIAGTVPAGVTAVNIHRTDFGGSSGGPFQYAATYAVTAGSSYPAMVITGNDSSVRPDILPPSWMQSPVQIAAATYYALSFAVAVSGGGPMAYSTTGLGMISPQNVLLCPANSYIGYGNAASSATYGSSVITGASTSTFTQGSIQSSNNPATNLQGFAGGMALRARCTTAFSGTATPTITYTYYDAAHGWGNLQTVTGVTPVSGFSSPALNAVITYTITAGRVVQSVTETSMSGTATSGAYLYESPFSRV